MKRWKNGSASAGSGTGISVPEKELSDSDDSELVYASKFSKYLRDEDGKDEDSVDYDFGGVVGSGALILYIPLTIYILNFSCTGDFCLNYESLSDFPSFIFYKYPMLLVRSFNPIKHLEAIGFLLCWYIFQAILAVGLPGKIVHSGPTGDTYKLNGHRAYLVTAIIVGLFYEKVPVLLDYYMELMTGSIFLATILSVFVYYYSFRSGQENVQLSPNVLKSKSKLYNFFIGRELNPRVFGDRLDLKFFCELRPGLFLWNLLNLAMLVKEYQIHGTISTQMILINIFQGLFVWDAIWNEEAILSTLDIIHEGFGFMLAVGDLAWLPFTYGLQAKYLLLYRDSIDPLPNALLGAIVLMKITGALILRLANNQKHAFRSGQLHNYTFLQTKAHSKKLLVSGWWGRARKINYTGDFLQGLSWCLLTGFNCWTPYFYVVYLFCLLRHRGQRDDKICYKKYGNDWLIYKKLVPYKYVPDLF